jgi:general secretion pathway protein A
MYEAFLGLREQPFRLTSDPRFFHLAEPHANALATLIEAVMSRKGLVVMTGPSGTGKTMVVHTTLHILAQRATSHRPISSAFLLNPTLSREEFLEAILAEFEIRCAETSKAARLEALQHMLLETRRKGGFSLLLVDEAHLLTEELLEEVRQLNNADQNAEKLLQIILCGQPELLDVLRRPELRALRERVECSCALRPLRLEEAEAYVAERLYCAGFRGQNFPFPAPVLGEIFRRTEGIPRLINLFCDTCLTISSKRQQAVIDLRVVEETALELGMSEECATQRETTVGAGRTIFDREAVDAMQSILAKAQARGFSAEQVQVHGPSLVASHAGQKAPGAIDETAVAASVNPARTVGACVSDSIAPPDEERRREKETRSATPLTNAKGTGESRVSLSTANNPELSLAKSRVLTLETMNQLPRKSRGRSIHGVLLSGNSWESGSPRRETPPMGRDLLAAWPRLALAVLRGIGHLNSRVQSQALAVLRIIRRANSVVQSRALVALPSIRHANSMALELPSRWVADFKRDWNAMIEAMAFREQRRSLLRWLREPIHANSWRRAGTSPLKTRRGFHS